MKINFNLKINLMIIRMNKYNLYLLEKKNHKLEINKFTR
jgi:hypothetical protein